MRIIELRSLDNGAHRNQTVFGTMTLPNGWALVPDELETPNFPFGEILAEENDGVMTVTTWSPLPIPEPAPKSEPVPSQLDRVEAQLTYTAMMTDTLLEV